MGAIAPDSKLTTEQLPFIPLNASFYPDRPEGHLTMLKLPGDEFVAIELVHDPEGAAVGYKWYDARKLEPAFPFGHGLTYTRFGYAGLTASAGNGTVTARFPLAQAQDAYTLAGSSSAGKVAIVMNE